MPNIDINWKTSDKIRQSKKEKYHTILLKSGSQNGSCQWSRIGRSRDLLFNGYRVTVFQDEKGMVIMAV